MVFDDVGRLAAAFAVCALLAGCATSGESGLSATNLVYDHRATTPAYPTEDPRLFPDDDINSAPSMIEGAVQCVPYVRAHSAIDIHGDAYTWWEKAAGLYQRSAAPAQGAVMVMVGYAGKHRAHVAVVRRVVTPREIRIDHANWLNDGAIYVNDPVVDVSPDNDWSQVKVWNIRSGTWGTKSYALKGFIGPGSADGNPMVSSSGVPTDDPIARQIAASGGAQDYPAAPTVDTRRARSIR
jgi:surface antigen